MEQFIKSLVLSTVTYFDVVDLLTWKYANIQLFKKFHYKYSLPLLNKAQTLQTIVYVQEITLNISTIMQIYNSYMFRKFHYKYLLATSSYNYNKHKPCIFHHQRPRCFLLPNLCGQMPYWTSKPFHLQFDDKNSGVCDHPG